MYLYGNHASKLLMIYMHGMHCRDPGHDNHFVKKVTEITILNLL